MRFGFARTTTTLTLGVLLTAFGLGAAAPAATSFPRIDMAAKPAAHVDNHKLLIRLDESKVNPPGATAVTALHAAVGGKVVRELRWPPSKSFPDGMIMQVVEFPDKAGLTQAKAMYAASPLVRYAVPDARVVAHASQAAVQKLPNDPDFERLWGMHNTGQTGMVDADVDAPEAWSIRTESKSARVLIIGIDSGIDYTHPDLAANYWQNPMEIAGNSIDDDGNGYVDDVRPEAA